MKTAIILTVMLASFSAAQTRFPVVRGSTFVQDHEDSTGKYRVVYHYGSSIATPSATFTIDTLGARSQPTGVNATVMVFRRQANGTWRMVGMPKTLKGEHVVQTIERAKQE